MGGRERASRLRNGTTGEVVAGRVSRAVTPWQRALGYLGRRTVNAREGLWFDRCSSIHTVGMRASIDVVFVDRDATVLRVVPRAPRNRFFTGGPRAAAVLELAGGVAEELCGPAIGSASSEPGDPVGAGAGGRTVLGQCDRVRRRRRSVLAA